MGNPDERNPQSDRGSPGKQQQQPGQKTHPSDKSDPKQSPGKDRGSSGTGQRQSGGSGQQDDLDE